ncbi:unnamed protein product [Knipowitschia caucasica]
MLLLLLLLGAPLVSAQVWRFGPCPHVETQQGFQVSKYLGRWYEITKLPASFESGKCIQANYALRSDGTIQVLNVATEYDGRMIAIEGTAAVRDPSEASKLTVSFSPFTPPGSYWVLSTDYDSLCPWFYSCTDILRLAHFEFAWILSRTETISNETRSRAEQVLVQAQVRLQDMVDTDQSECNTLML